VTPRESDLFAVPDPTRPRAADGSRIYTVSELTREIRSALEYGFAGIWVSGEVSNQRRPASGHCYFTLKDAAAQLNAVMWRSLADALRFQLRDGLAVLVQGDVTVYEPRGQYQIIVRHVVPLGVGALQLAFIQLKEKLAAEGLFDAERKRPLPLVPRCIAIVTSPTGAAVRDMLNVIYRRFPGARVLICPVRVQGDRAAAEIAAMIETVNRLPSVDVMIVGRGGGSIEDLWPFNEEVVARAIAASRVPVVSAVGHETDFTIADFVADVRALTPTDGAARVTPDLEQFMQDLRALKERLGKALQSTLAAARERLDGLARSYALRRPLERIRLREQRLDDLAHQLYRSTRHVLELRRQRLSGLSDRLESLSPLAVLARGYSITLRDADGSLVRDPATVRIGETIRTLLHGGVLWAEVRRSGPTPPLPRPNRLEEETDG